MATKIITLFALITFCAMPCMAKVKGNGKIITKQIPVGEYSSISLGNKTIGYGSSWFSFFSRGSNTSYVFDYKQGNPASLQITIDENLYPYLQAKITNGELTITTKDNEELIPTSLKISGTSKELNKIHTSGNMNFSLKSPLSGDKLEVLSTAGSDISLKQPVQVNRCTISAKAGGDVIFTDLTCESIDCHASSGSDIKLKGKTVDAFYKASSGSDIKSSDFIVTNLECSASGGSDIYTYVTGNLKASASGGSDIHYKGNPRTNISTSGGSDIIKEGF